MAFTVEILFLEIELLTCQLPALFPLPVAIETADTGAIVSAGVI